MIMPTLGQQPGWTSQMWIHLNLKTEAACMWMVFRVESGRADLPYNSASHLPPRNFAARLYAQAN